MNYRYRVFDETPGAGFSVKSAFTRARKAEISFAARLRKIGAHIGEIVRGFDPTSPSGMLWLRVALERYAQVLAPWATAVANSMITEVAARDRQAWQKVSAQMGRALHKEIESAPTGEIMRRLLSEQVALITSLPIEAAQRVHDLTIKGVEEGSRFPEIAAEIMRTGEVVQSRANLIARTETARTSSVLTQARAVHIGATQYVWRTARDRQVRPTHRALEGKVIDFDDPPECDPGYHAHAGQIWNCRCYMEIIIPDTYH